MYTQRQTLQQPTNIDSPQAFRQETQQNPHGISSNTMASNLQKEKEKNYQIPKFERELVVKENQREVPYEQKLMDQFYRKEPDPTVKEILVEESIQSDKIQNLVIQKNLNNPKTDQVCKSSMNKNQEERRGISERRKSQYENPDYYFVKSNNEDIFARNDVIFESPQQIFTSDKFQERKGFNQQLETRNTQENPIQSINSLNEMKTQDRERTQQLQQQQQQKFVDLKDIDKDIELAIKLKQKANDLLNDISSQNKISLNELESIVSKSDFNSFDVQVRLIPDPTKLNYHTNRFPNLKDPSKALMHRMINDTQECCLCHSQKVYNESLECSKIEEVKTNSAIMKENLEKKYLTSREYYNVKVINDIIYNENAHIVSVFKDYLIFDDVSEFLKRFYNKYESLQRLPKMYQFYEKNQRFYPSYITLPENRYMFKNQARKQRIKDEKLRIIEEKRIKKEKEQKYELGQSLTKGNNHRDRFNKNQFQNSDSFQEDMKLFDTKFIESVANIEPLGRIDSSMGGSKIMNSQWVEQFDGEAKKVNTMMQKRITSNVERKEGKTKSKNFSDMNLDELISKFVAKDSQSQIQQSTLVIENIDLNEEILKRPEHRKEMGEKILTKQTEKEHKVFNYEQHKQIQQQEKQEIIKDKATLENKMNYEKEQRVKQQRVCVDKPTGVINYNNYNNYNQFINTENYYIGQEEFVRNQNGEPSQENYIGKIKQNIVKKPPREPTNTCQTPMGTEESRNHGSRQSKSQNKIVRVNKEKINKMVQGEIYETGNTQGNLSNRGHISTREREEQQPLIFQNQVMEGLMTARDMRNDHFRRLSVGSDQNKNKQGFSSSKQKEKLVNIPLPSRMSQNPQSLKQTLPQTTQGKSSERRTQIENEIERDYEKYLQDNGLSKNSMAKTLLALREKNFYQNLQPLTERTSLDPSNMNYPGKRYSLGNDKRTHSNSQKRIIGDKRSPSVNQQNHLGGSQTTRFHNQENQKDIRTLRAKTSLNHHESSSYIRSQKISPQNQNLLQFQETNQNYVLPPQGRQKSKGNKQIIVKMPYKDQNLKIKSSVPSNAQTPKRIKMVKTQSVSNIPQQFKNQFQGTQTNMFRDKQNEIYNEQLVVGKFIPQKTQYLNPTIPQISSNSKIKRQETENIFLTTQQAQNTIFQTTQGSMNQSIPNSPISFNNTKQQSKITLSQNRISKKQTKSNINNSNKKVNRASHQRTGSTISNTQNNSGSKSNIASQKRLSLGNDIPINTSIGGGSSAMNTNNLLQFLMSSFNQTDENGQSLTMQTIKNLQNGLNSQQKQDFKTFQQIKENKMQSSNRGKHTKSSSGFSQGKPLTSKPSSILMGKVTKKINSKNSGKHTERNESKKRHTPSKKLPNYENINEILVKYNQMKENQQELQHKVSQVLSNADKMILGSSKSSENLHKLKANYGGQFEDQRINDEQMIQNKFLQSIKQIDFNGKFGNNNGIVSARGGHQKDQKEQEAHFKTSQNLNQYIQNQISNNLHSRRLSDRIYSQNQ